MSNGYDTVLVIVDKLTNTLYSFNDYYNYPKKNCWLFFHHVKPNMVSSAVISDRDTWMEGEFWRNMQPDGNKKVSDHAYHQKPMGKLR